MKNSCLIFTMIVSMFAGLCACEEKWESQIELGVNDTRLNITQYLDPGYFILPVYSNRRWQLEIVVGAEWLTADCTSGQGTQYVRFDYDANNAEEARVAELMLTGGRQIKVFVVQSGSSQAADDIDDVELTKM